MLLRPDLPALDAREIARPWLTPEEALDVAGLWTRAASPQRKFFSNIAARGLISGIASGPGLTAPRLYSLETAVKLAVMWGLNLRGRTYEVAAAVGDAVVGLLRHLVETLPSSAGVDTPDEQFTVVYTVSETGLIASSGQGATARAQWTDSPALSVADLQNIDGFEAGVVHASPVLRRCLERYTLRLLAAREAGA